MTTPFWQAGTLYPPGSLVQPVTAPPIVATPIANPGFESGSANWTLGGGWTTGAFGAGTAFTGSQSAQFNLTGSGNISSTSTGVVTPGQSITASCMVQQGASSAGQAGARVVIVWTTAADVFISQTEGNLVDNASGGAWLQSTATGIAPAGAGKAYVRAAAFRLSGSSPLWVDTFTWNHTGPAAPTGLVYKAVQALTASSAASEPVWPLTPLATVVDGGVTWQATVATRVVWEAEPILKSGGIEPTWPVSPGASIADGTIRWEAISRQVVDLNCPNSTVVAIMASKVFAADGDIVRFSATANPLNWTAEKDAGFLATGLQQANANDMAVLAPYRGNMAAFNASSFQNWQVDPDPTAMAILDQMDGIGSIYHKAAVPVGDELLFLAALGVRSVSMSGGNESLSAGDVGMPVDPLVQEAIAIAAESGIEPIATYYPALGQYWLAFRQATGPAPVPPVISGDAPDSLINTAYNFGYTVTGDNPPFTVARVAGTNPVGLTLSSAGVWTGTTGPTPGATSFSVQATDALGLLSNILPDSIEYLPESSLEVVPEVKALALNTTNGELIAAFSSNVIKSTDNGSNWTVTATSNAPTAEVEWIEHLSSYFGESAASLVSSADGLTWTNLTAGGAPATTDLAYSPTLDMIVIVSDGVGNRANYSTDGVTWTPVTFSPAAPVDWNGKAFVWWDAVNARFFMNRNKSGASGFNRLYTSTDGMTFTLLQTKAGSGVHATEACVFWAPNLSLWVWMGTNSGSRLYRTSPDLTFWTNRDATLTQAELFRFCIHQDVMIIDGVPTTCDATVFGDPGALYGLTSATALTETLRPDMLNISSFKQIFLPAPRRIIRTGQDQTTFDYVVQTLYGI